MRAIVNSHHTHDTTLGDKKLTMTAPSETQTPEPTWSVETRTWVSLLLFAHLFAVIVAVSAYTRPSVLQERLHNLFETYLRNLHLTALPTSYPYARFHLTHAGPTDVDYSIEVDVERTDGSAATLTLPPTPLQPLIRFRRYQALVNATGTLASGEMGDGLTSILPKAIAGSLLRRENATGGVIHIRALGLADLAQMASLADVARAAEQNVSNVYEAEVIVSRGSVELLRKSTTLEVAPVEDNAAPPAPTPSRSAPAVPRSSRP